MKAYGVGLEFTVELSDEEIRNLNEHDLSGKILLREHRREENRTITFTISTKFPVKIPFRIPEDVTDDLYHDGVFVKTCPDKTYLPIANDIKLFLAKESYTTLVANRRYVTRFHTGGKVKIIDKNVARDGF